MKATRKMSVGYVVRTPGDRGGRVVARIDAPPPATRMTLQEVGDVLGVTKERVRQIENEALRKFCIGVARALIEAGDVTEADLAAMGLEAEHAISEAPDGRVSAGLAASPQR